MRIIELIKVENGFVTVVGPEPEEERGKVKYYVARDSQEVADIFRNITDELKGE